MARIKTAHGSNPIFDDEIYQRCAYASTRSKCQKMNFGCVITHKGRVVYEGCNSTIEALKSICEPQCIRLSIESRTHSMLGACGHAEEGLWHVVHDGIPIQECYLYVAGFFPNRRPWLKERVEHTCLRCAVLMNGARVGMIFVPVVDRWEGLTTESALQTALRYALRERRGPDRLTTDVGDQ
jgi:hypothetical protein